MILVTGAGGKTGRAVVAALLRRGERVRVLLRRADQSATFGAGDAVEVAIGNFDQPATLTAATMGVRAIYHICPNVTPDEFGYGRAVLMAAQANAVCRFVFHSVLHPQIEAMPHHWQKMRIEELLLAGDFELTVLQPAAYMQNIQGAWSDVLKEGTFRVPYPIETRLSLVDLEDVAEAAAVVLSTDGHGGATYELVGSPPLRQTEIATAIGIALRRDVRAEAEPVEAWEATMRAAGMADYPRLALVKMFRYYASHGLTGNPNVLRWLLKRPTTTLASFLERIVSRARSDDFGFLVAPPVTADAGSDIGNTAMASPSRANPNDAMETRK